MTLGLIPYLTQRIPPRGPLYPSSEWTGTSVFSSRYVCEPTKGRKGKASAVLAQFVKAGVFTPDPWHLFVLLGLPLVVTILTFNGLVPLAERDEREPLIKGWFLAGGLLIYVPASFQTHYLNGWQIPIAILAAKAFVGRVLSYLKRYRDSDSPYSWRRAAWHIGLPGALLLVVCGTNIYLTGWSMNVLSRHEAPYYLTQGDAEAMSWLEAHTHPQEVVLSSLHTGPHIPSRTGNKPFIARWAATVDFLAKRKAVKRFYDAARPTPSERDCCESTMCVTATAEAMSAHWDHSSSLREVIWSHCSSPQT